MTDLMARLDDSIKGIVTTGEEYLKHAKGLESEQEFYEAFAPIHDLMKEYLLISQEHKVLLGEEDS